MASGSGERSRSWVMAGEPRHSVDSRLITVDSDWEDLLSGVTDGVPPANTAVLSQDHTLQR